MNKPNSLRSPILRAARVSLFAACALAFFSGPLARIATPTLSIISAAQTQPSPAPYESGPLSPAAFASELHHINDSLRQTKGTRGELSAIRARLPVKWQVNAADHQYEISTEPLRSLLSDAERNPAHQAARVSDAEVWLAHLEDQVGDYSQLATQKDSGARKQLDAILQRREFAAVGPPSEWEKLKQKMYAWLFRMIEKLLTQIGKHPLGAKVLFWLLVAGAIAWLATMLFRFWGGRARMEELASTASVASRRSWQEWIRAARFAADRGNFRESVHSAYWAGIAYLEDLGAISVDRTRTPRESLRVLDDESVAALPAERVKRRESLAALTSRLERIWYGLRPARAEDFEESMRQLEELGCRWR